MSNKYQTVALDEEPFLAKEEGVVDEKWTEGTERKSILDRLSRLSPHWAFLCHAVLLSLSATFFALSFCSKAAKITDADYTAKYSTWSPARSAIKYETKHFDLPPFTEGPFVGMGDDVDAAWEEIAGVGHTMISREELVKLGLNPETSLAITDPRDGKPGYRIALEVFHQLHCLNLLRKNVYREYYPPLGGDTSAEMEDPTGHLDHCIEALRQFVMCQGDVGVISFDVLGENELWPNYSTARTCRNFNSIRQWGVDHTVPRGPNEPEH
ncbi:hypothetical protein F4811DRAFT_503743 [Daldinia bambusicola]|nr:hypothetical protein F4811DRAFT_503743 [Daldinia bambusicola]